MSKSKIEWTDATWNPVTGCTKVSTGCKHCYAERLFPRVYGSEMVRDVSMSGLLGEPVERKRKFTDVKLHPERLDAPLHWKKPRMIFVNSMSDLFHEDIPFEFIWKVFCTMFNARQHTFQILTKRPQIMLEYFKHHYAEEPAPLPNVWLGISCENQTTADERIPILLQVPAAVRFLSCEPLLDEIDLEGKAFWTNACGCTEPETDISTKDCPHCNGTAAVTAIDWVIVGGESGPGYRPMKPEWAKSIIEQCQAARLPVFMKQMAGKKRIPEDLQIREYPINGGNK